MTKILVICTLISLIMIFAADVKADNIVYQTDKYGNQLKHLPHLVIKDSGKVYMADKFNNQIKQVAKAVKK